MNILQAVIIIQIPPLPSEVKTVEDGTSETLEFSPSFILFETIQVIFTGLELRDLKMGDAYTFCIAMFAALGTFLFVGQAQWRY